MLDYWIALNTVNNYACNNVHIMNQSIIKSSATSLFNVSASELLAVDSTAHR